MQRISQLFSRTNQTFANTQTHYTTNSKNTQGHQPSSKANIFKYQMHNPTYDSANVSYKIYSNQQNPTLQQQIPKHNKLYTITKIKNMA